MWKPFSSLLMVRKTILLAVSLLVVTILPILLTCILQMIHSPDLHLADDSSPSKPSFLDHLKQGFKSPIFNLGKPSFQPNKPPPRVTFGSSPPPIIHHANSPASISNLTVDCDVLIEPPEGEICFERKPPPPAYTPTNPTDLHYHSPAPPIATVSPPSVSTLAPPALASAPAPSRLC